MDRKSFRQFLNDQLFWIILFFVAVIVSCGGSIIRKLDAKIVRNKSEATVCFGGDLTIYWNAPDEYKQSLKKVCRKMERLGIEPLDKLQVNISSFDKCDEKTKKKTACYAYFQRLSESANGRGIAEIHLPAESIKNESVRESFLAHELSHALVSKLGYDITRAVDEFFAVYTQFKVNRRQFHFTCDSESFNQTALATHRGSYPFPPDTENK